MDAQIKSYVTLCLGVTGDINYVLFVQHLAVNPSSGFGF